MILKTKNGFLFELIAIKKVNGKIHIKHKKGLTTCSKKINDIDNYEIDEIENKNHFISIIKDINFCKKCKDRILESIDNDIYFFQVEGSELIKNEF